jgi:hypothetical protein
VEIPLDYPKDAEVEVRDVIYEKNAAGFVDTLHGKYIVHLLANHIESELIMTFYKCDKLTNGLCVENPRDFTENLTCMRFLTDKTGPWYIFAPSVDQMNICMQFEGTYEFKGAKIQGEFLQKYMEIEEGHYRIRLLNHLPHENMDLKNLCGCIELDFDILP